MNVQDMINQMTDPTLTVVTIFQLPIHDKKNYFRAVQAVQHSQMSPTDGIFTGLIGTAENDPEYPKNPNC